MRGEAGESMIAVMFAIAMTSLLLMGLMRTTANFNQVRVQAKYQNQFQNIESVFRGSIVCAAKCQDLLASIPKSIDGWEIEARCENNAPKLRAKHSRYRHGDWVDVFAGESAGAICKNEIPVVEGGAPRKYCPAGQVVVAIDFDAKEIQCE